MRKPDMFERMVIKVYHDEGLSDEEFPSEYELFVKLFRRQHARVVRMVKQMKDKRLSNSPSFDEALGHELVCNDILAALAKMKRRTT